MSPTPCELKCEDEMLYRDELTDTIGEDDDSSNSEDFNIDSQNNAPQQSSEDIIEFLQSDTHKMHLI